MNITTTFLGVLGFAIFGPLVMAAMIAGMMSWLSRQVPVGAPAPLEAALAKARSQRPPVGKPASPAAPQTASAAATVTQAAAPELEIFVTEAARLEKEETHQRLVPLWLAVVYAVVIVWALIYILIEVVPFFKPLTPQSVPASAVAPAAGATTPPPALAYSGPGNAVNGERLFMSQGCSACHSLKEGERSLARRCFISGRWRPIESRATITGARPRRPKSISTNPSSSRMPTSCRGSRRVSCRRISVKSSAPKTLPTSLPS